MDLTWYVNRVRRELAVAAEAGGEDAQALAERLTAPLDSAIRLTLLDALSAAAEEITRELAPGSVEVRLRGGDPSFAVSPPPVEGSYDEAAGGSLPAESIGVMHDAGSPLPDLAAADEGATTRINVRLPEGLKTRIEEAAGREGRSVNAWLVRAAATALNPSAPDDPTSAPARSRRQWGAQGYTGWVQ